MHIDREDMLELTRRMTVSRNCFSRIAGAYMDEEGFIDGTFNTHFLKLSGSEKEKNLNIAKLGLSTDADCYFVSRVDICFSLCLLYFFFISKMQRYIDGIVDCYWHSPYSDFCLHSIRGKLDFSYFSICGTWYAK